MMSVAHIGNSALFVKWQLYYLELALLHTNQKGREEVDLESVLAKLMNLSEMMIWQRVVDCRWPFGTQRIKPGKLGYSKAFQEVWNTPPKKDLGIPKILPTFFILWELLTFSVARKILIVLLFIKYKKWKFFSFFFFFFFFSVFWHKKKLEFPMFRISTILRAKFKPGNFQIFN